MLFSFFLFSPMLFLAIFTLPPYWASVIFLHVWRNLKRGNDVANFFSGKGSVNEW